MTRYRGRHAAARGVRRRTGRLRRGVSAAALATAAMAALTASQAPDGFGDEGSGSVRADSAPGEDGARDGAQGDDSYHTELPPLESPALSPGTPGWSPGADRASQSGIPATVLDAYRRAERALAASAPGCGLRWELLAAIGKVESGQARGGAVDAHGTTLRPILGPVLDGNGFARITDTDGGRWDGDGVYDRAVGPMQFIPSTWARWGSDGNADGREDPANIYDAALAAGRYLCAGGRDLTSRAGLEAAVLSYNASRAYLRTVLSWYAFYREGVREVPDGQGPLPTSAGAGNEERPAERPRGGKGSGAHERGHAGGNGGGGGGGGRGAGSGGNGSGGGGSSGGGPQRPGDDSPAPKPPKPTPSESGDPGSPDPSEPPCPSPTGSPSPSSPESSPGSPSPSASPSGSGSPTASPSPGETCR
ncbi:lytic transglycosylase domain-containing protein [Streptomyces sp. NPDC054796]